MVTVDFIPLDKIKPLHRIKISDAYLKRMKSTHNFLLEYDLLLAVEKNSMDDKYTLVGGYDKYLYLSSIGQQNALCIVENISPSECERLTKILRRLFNVGDSTKENRQVILKLLKGLKVSINTIIEKTGFTENELQSNYIYNSRIPTIYINENTSEKTMNWVESLNLHQEIKYFLFKRAGLPVGDPKRLTFDKIKIIKEFLKEESRFEYLSLAQQTKVLSCAINFKGLVIEWLKSLVTEYTIPHKVI